MRSRFLAIVAAIAAMPAFASGQEGAALVPVVQLIVFSTLFLLIACVLGGAIHGLIKANRADEPALQGFFRGILKGLLAFVILGAIAFAIVTVLGALWLAWAFIAGSQVQPSS